MRIEDLNKTQIVLLTLLVSFVTSIATGIVTVSLMEQAPQSLPQTINRVIERTVEKVTPAVDGKPSTITKETTVVVKEEDLITKSIEKIKDSVVAVRVRSINSEGLAQETFVGWGIVVGSDGQILTDSNIIQNSSEYTIVTNSGVTFPVKVVSQDTNLGSAILSVIRQKGNSEQEKYTFIKAPTGDSSKLKLGQTAIALGGKARISVAIGVISGLRESVSSVASSTQASKVSVIEASVMPPNNVSGGVLVNSFGEVIGIYLKGENGEKADGYMPL
jgi:S1-C subfamily serine protease